MPPSTTDCGCRARRPRMARRAVARTVMWPLPFIAVAAALFLWLGAGRFVGTDNAYVKGDRVYIATEISGPIVEVAVHENQSVSRGQLLFRLDDQPYRRRWPGSMRRSRRARRHPRPARAVAHQARGHQGGAKPDELRPGRLRPPGGPLRPQVRAGGRRLRGVAHGARRRAPAHRLGGGGSAAHRGGARRRSQDPDRRSSRGEADAGGARRGPAHLRRTTIESPLDGIVSKRAGAGQLRHRRGCRSIAVVADTRSLGRGQLQGDRAHPYAARPDGDGQGRHLSRRRLHAKVESLSPGTGADFSLLPPRTRPATG